MVVGENQPHFCGPSCDLLWPQLVIHSSPAALGSALILEQLCTHAYVTTWHPIPALPHSATPQITLLISPWAWGAYQWTFPPSGGWMGEEAHCQALWVLGCVLSLGGHFSLALKNPHFVGRWSQGAL